MLAGSAFRIPLCAALCALACPVLARDQPTPQPSVERRAVPAERMNDGERITLDGIFDEPVWKRARPADDFIQVDPSNGRPATEATEVRIAFSDDVFYMAVTCFDSEPDKAVAAEGVRFHLARFWDPRMRREIIAHANAGGAGLEATARRAVELLAERPNSPNQSK